MSLRPNIRTKIAIGVVLALGALAPAGAQPPTAESATPAKANLAQLMRGTLYPESNIVFASQDTNPAEVQHAKDPSMATDLLMSTYGKWDAVENSALAIAEVADLLMVPRKCANGVDVPLKDPNWSKWVQEMRDAGMTAYAAAQTKNQDKMTEAAEVMTTACKHCHDRYREKRNRADRCK